MNLWKNYERIPKEIPGRIPRKINEGIPVDLKESLKEFSLANPRKKYIKKTRKQSVKEYQKGIPRLISETISGKNPEVIPKTILGVTNDIIPENITERVLGGTPDGNAGETCVEIPRASPKEIQG